MQEFADHYLGLRRFVKINDSEIKCIPLWNWLLKIEQSSQSK